MWPNPLDGVTFDVNKVVQQAIDALGKYGPTIWGAAYRQVYVNAVTNLVWFAALGIAAWISFRFARHFYRSAWVPENPDKVMDDHFGEWVMTGLCAAVVLIFAGLAVSAATEAISNLLNPTWAALQLLKP